MRRDSSILGKQLKRSRSRGFGEVADEEQDIAKVNVYQSKEKLLLLYHSVHISCIQFLKCCRSCLQTCFGVERSGHVGRGLFYIL